MKLLLTRPLRAQLMERIAAHDTLQSRAISIALKRINSGPKQVQGYVDNLLLGQIDSSTGCWHCDFDLAKTFLRYSAIAVSHFNTLRAQKAVGDSSTVDFIFLPTNLDHSLHDETFNMRVPILPDSFHIGSTQTVHTDTAPVMRPEIYSVSGSPDIAGPSPMSEVLDNTAIDIDPFSLTETVTRAAHKVVSGEQEVSSVKAFLGGFVEDLLGPAKSTSLA